MVHGKNVVSPEPPYMEGQFVVVKDSKRTYDAEILYAGTFIVMITFLSRMGMVSFLFCEMQS